MISGNRMVKKNQNQSVDPKPNIHKLSDYNGDYNSGGDAYKVIKPKKQNIAKVDNSLKQPMKQAQEDRKAIHRNSLNNDNKQNVEKPKFMSIARHGLKIGGQVIGKDKWQCKVCKLVNLNSSSQCLRCQSDKGELKQNNPQVKAPIKPGVFKQNIPRQVIKSKPS